MTKPTSPSPLARLVKSLLPAPAPAPQPQPEEQPDQDPTVKMYRFIKYGD